MRRLLLLVRRYPWLVGVLAVVMAPAALVAVTLRGQQETIAGQRATVAAQQVQIQELRQVVARQDSQIAKIQVTQQAMCRGFDGVARRQLPAGAAPNELDVVQAGRDVVAILQCGARPPGG